MRDAERKELIRAVVEAPDAGEAVGALARRFAVSPAPTLEQACEANYTADVLAQTCVSLLACTAPEDAGVEARGHGADAKSSATGSTWLATWMQPDGRLRWMAGETAKLGGMSMLSPDDVHRAWQDARKAGRTVRHPLGPLVRHWTPPPKPLAKTNLLLTRDAAGTMLSRAPAVLAVAGLAIRAVEVDGEPFASEAGPKLPVGARRRRYATAPRPAQAELWATPATLDGNAVAGTLLEAVSSLPLTGDERHPIRADVYRLGLLSYALAGPARLTPDEGSMLVARAVHEEGRRRWALALRFLRYLSVRTPDGWEVDMVDAETGPERGLMGPPRWWLAGEGGPRRYGRVGGLFRDPTRWGAVERTVTGIEHALVFSPAAGRGRGGRTSAALIPVRRGGPGPKRIVPWWLMLMLAGEHVGPDADSHGAAGERYRRRMDALKAAGLVCPPSGSPAPAGDTVEIVRAVRGTKATPAHVVVRATARWCAAYEHGRQVRLLGGDVLTLTP